MESGRGIISEHYITVHLVLIRLALRRKIRKYDYMFNVDKNQLSWQTGSRNLMVPKTLPTI
jgi:hypothetical protein